MATKIAAALILLTLFADEKTRVSDKSPLAVAIVVAAEKPAGDPKALGSPTFVPTPEHPCGWRGDWTGRYPGATPPLVWSRRVKGSTTEIKYQARKPAGAGVGKDAVPLEYFTIKDWLVAGPFDAADPKTGIESDYLGGETTVAPNDGDKAGSVAWKFVHAGVDNQTSQDGNKGNACGSLFVDFVYLLGNIRHDAKEGAMPQGQVNNKVAYAHTYIFSPTGGTFKLRELNCGATAKTWLNGKPLQVAVETNQNGGDKKDEVVALAPGWNRLLVKVASASDPKKVWDHFSYWRMATYLLPNGPVSYETKNIAWMTRVTGRSMSQPIVVGDKIFFGSNISDLMCVGKNDGKVLWIHSNTPWDALSAEDKAKFNSMEPLVAKLEKLNEDMVATINGMVSPTGMTSGQQAALNAKLKEKRDWQINIEKELKALDRRRFVPLSEDEVSASNATPCSDGSRIYWGCGGARGMGPCLVCCYDLNGKRLWSYYEVLLSSEHGTHLSPFLADGKLVYGYGEGQIAFDAATGKQAWKQLKSVETTLASPVPVRIGGETVSFYISSGGWLTSLTRVSDGTQPATARALTLGISTPVIENDIAYVIDKFKSWEGGNTFAAYQLPTSLAQKSDIKLLYELDWNEPTHGSDVTYACSSPLYVNGLVYALNVGGGLMIVDTQARKPVYHGWLNWYCRFHRLLYGAVASPTLAGNHIYLVDNSGYTIIIKPGPSYQEECRNVLENISEASFWSGNPCSQEPFYTSPVFSGDNMYLRGEEYLYCLKNK